jgi:integrase
VILPDRGSEQLSLKHLVLASRRQAVSDPSVTNSPTPAELLSASFSKIVGHVPYTTGLAGGPFTLHQLRHSTLTHAAEAGASTPMLMALSGHTSVRSLAQYARVSAEALSRWQAERDPAARRNTSRSQTR